VLYTLKQLYQDKPIFLMITPHNPLILKRLGQHLEPIETLCQQWGIHQLALFGSILREDFGTDSDVDLLVDFSPGKKISLLDLLELEYQFSEILERPIDLVEKQAIIQSPNWIRRQEVLNTAQIIYEQG
jgi:hypothetical protein